MNYKMTIGTLLIFTLFLQIGCSDQEGQKNANEEGSTEEQSEEETATNKEKEDTEIMDQFHTMTENDTELGEVITYMEEHIASLPADDASVMVNEFEAKQKENLSTLEEKFNDEAIVEKLRNAFEPGSEINAADVEDEELKSLLTEVNDTGYKMETAEGKYFPVINYEFYKEYRSYVTSDVKDYIDMMALESNQVPAKDAALVIEWDEILKRALNQEEFIKNYPDSEKIKEVEQLYRNYVNYTFFGLNNTPLFDYESKTMVDDAKKAYEQAVENGEDSELLKELKGFLDVSEKENDKLTDEVDDYRNKASERLLSDVDTE